jgi:hypothetical protein
MRNLWLVVVIAALLALASIWGGRPSEAATGSFNEAKVRLFSDGQVVGEWLAVGPGRVEGSTFVFPVRKGARDLEVRISGTFSFEQQP